MFCAVCKFKIDSLFLKSDTQKNFFALMKALLKRWKMLNEKKCFSFHIKSSRSCDISSKFCPDFCGHVGKLLNEKAKVNFKIYYVTY